MSTNNPLNLSEDDLDLLTDKQRIAYEKGKANHNQVLNWIKEANDSIEEYYSTVLSNIINFEEDLDKIKGNKQITFILGGITGSFGCSNNDTESKDKFFGILRDYFLNGENCKDICILVIRQFLNEKVDYTDSEGNTQKTLKKNIYQAILSFCDYRWMNDEECFEMQNMNSNNHEVMEIEPGVTCCGFNL